MPADAAITPYLHCSSDNVFNFTNAPRTLKEPVLCKDSIFKKSLVPVSLENVSDACKGVFLIGVPLNESLALIISSIVGRE